MTIKNDTLKGDLADNKLLKEETLEEVEDEKQNSLSQKSQIRYIRHCKAGLATYPDETLLLQDETLKQMIPSMVGIPIYVDHVDDIDMDDAQGFVVESFYNPLDGCYWAKCIITDDAAINKLANGFGASNSYKPKKSGDGGLYHGTNYDREILDAEYTHLALVQNPRYNESLILTPEQYKEYNEKLESELKQLTNSLDDNTKKENTQMTNKDEKGFFKKLADVFNNAADEEEKDEKDEKENCKKNEDDGKDKEIAELKEKLNKLQKKNEEDEKKKDEEDKDNEDEEDEDEEKSKDEKKNSLEQSFLQSKTSQVSNEYHYVTRQDKVKLGQDLY